MDTSDMVDQEMKSSPEITAEVLAAWNHGVEESEHTNCSFPGCVEVFPFVEHLKKLRSEGVVDVCRESCKMCTFYTTLKTRVIPTYTSRRQKKEAAKQIRLIWQFTSLLLMHKEQNSDPQIESLYHHVMGCSLPDGECEFRQPIGSCCSSRQLMMHLQECKARDTKSCTLCSNLPPKVKRMKQSPRSLPVPVMVRQTILQRRKETQRLKKLRKRQELQGVKEEIDQEDIYSDELDDVAMVDGDSSTKRRISEVEFFDNLYVPLVKRVQLDEFLTVFD